MAKFLILILFGAQLGYTQAHGQSADDCNILGAVLRKYRNSGDLGDRHLRDRLGELGSTLGEVDGNTCAERVTNWNTKAPEFPISMDDVPRRQDYETTRPSRESVYRSAGDPSAAGTRGGTCGDRECPSALNGQ